MQPHQLRVVQEKAELDTKIDSLASFTKLDLFKTGVAEDEKLRMLRQLAIMQAYSQVLGERIAAFGGSHG